MNSPRIYLDANATTRLDSRVRQAMDRCADVGLGNPSSQHASGRRARQILEDAREQIAQLLGASLTGGRADRLIFTSGGTEANNLALLGQPCAAAGSTRPVAMISDIEHPSITATAAELARRGWTIQRLPVTAMGIVDLEALKPQLAEHRPGLISIMLANNETGLIQPLAEIAALCAPLDAVIHTDAVQMVGKLPVCFRDLGVSTFSFSAHKFHGPVGIGGLLVRHDVRLAPQLFGGHQQNDLRGGTESVLLAVGMAAALDYWHRDQDERWRRMADLRDRFEGRLRAAWPGMVIHGQHSPRLPNTTNIAFPGFDRQALFMALDLAGVECSTGSACASGASEPSPTLVAMGLVEELVSSSLRFSLDATTTIDEVDQTVDRIAAVLGQLSRRTSVPKMAPAARQIPSGFL